MGVSFPLFSPLCSSHWLLLVYSLYTFRQVGGLFCSGFNIFYLLPIKKKKKKKYICDKLGAFHLYALPLGGVLRISFLIHLRIFPFSFLFSLLIRPLTLFPLFALTIMYKYACFLSLLINENQRILSLFRIRNNLFISINKTIMMLNF